MKAFGVFTLFSKVDKNKDFDKEFHLSKLKVDRFALYLTKNYHQISPISYTEVN